MEKMIIFRKKGILFSIVSVFVIMLFVSSFELASKFDKVESEIDVTRTRVRVLNSIMDGMNDQYIDNIIYTSSKNSIYGLSKFYSEDYSRLKTRLLAALRSTLQAGILDDSGVKINLTNYNNKVYIKQGLTIGGILAEMKTEFNKINVEIKQFEVFVVDVSQDDPWYLNVTAEINYYFSDKDNIASWKGRTIRSVKVPVYGLYSYDGESVGKSNKGLINNTWKVDQGPEYTESSTLNKLSFGNPRVRLSDHGLGLCSARFDCTSD